MKESLRPAVRLHVVIPFYQPITSSEAELEQLWAHAYAPLVEKLAAHKAKVVLHVCGHLLDFLAKRREETLVTIKRLATGKRIEVLGGLYYGGLPALLPELDVRGQVQMLSEYWESALGFAPPGFWLPELGWSAELPRLLQETGLTFGFASRLQAVTRPNLGGLAVIERGEQRLNALLLDPVLSAALPTRPVDEWIDAALDRASSQPGPLSVCLPAERLFTHDGEVRLGHEKWLDAFLSAIGGDRKDIGAVLPSETMDTAKVATPARLHERMVVERDGKPAELGSKWAALPESSAALESMHRRMLRVSEKLREAISSMEDEELDDSWSDSLATAQRLLFAAQAPDAYVADSGASGESVRAATLARLLRAECMIDGLVQGSDDWIATEEEDSDADLVDEVFACTRHLTACIAPAAGGQLRAIDDRISAVAVLDASLSPSTLAHGEWIVESGVAATDVLAGKAAHLFGKALWQVHETRIDEEGDCAFHMHLSAEAALDGGGDRSLKIDKRVRVPIDEALVCIKLRARLTGSPEAMLLAPLPVRLNAPVISMAHNGNEVSVTVSELQAVTTLRLEAESGHALELTCEPACDVYLAARGPQGVVLMPSLALRGDLEATFTLRIEPVPAFEAEAVEGEEEEVEEDAEGSETEDASDAETEEEVDGEETEEEDGEAPSDEDEAESSAEDAAAGGGPAPSKRKGRD